MSFGNLYNGISVNGDLRYEGGRGAGDTIGVVTFTAAGNYPISLLWFQGGGGSEWRAVCRLGQLLRLDATMKLVGDMANHGPGHGRDPP